MATDDTKLVILHEHYKDSFAHLQSHLKLRDKLFIGILGVIILMLFHLFSPVQAQDTISQVITNQLRLSTPMDVSFFGSVIWFALLALLIRYYQTVVHMERQYGYIHKLEEQLSGYYGNTVAFTREGKTYLSDYPLFSQWASILYTVIFPLLLLIVVSAKILAEVRSATGLSPVLAFNVLIFLGVAVSTFLYLMSVHSPQVSRLAAWLAQQRAVMTRSGKIGLPRN